MKGRLLCLAATIATIATLGAVPAAIAQVGSGAGADVRSCRDYGVGIGTLVLTPSDMSNYHCHAADELTRPPSSPPGPLFRQDGITPRIACSEIYGSADVDGYSVGTPSGNVLFHCRVPDDFSD